MAGVLVPANWLDRAIAYVAPGAGARRLHDRHVYNTLSGYDAATPSRNRKSTRIDRSGDVFSRIAALPLRAQARYLDRNHDISNGALTRLADFVVGDRGINVEPMPKRRDGTVHEDYAKQLAVDWAKFCEWPEVTWTHDWSASCRLVVRSWLRDGDVFAQLITGPRNDRPYSQDIPVAVELLEADFVPHDLNLPTRNIRQGIERNGWGRPTAYHVLLVHPGDDMLYSSTITSTTPTIENTKPVPAENMLHLRNVDRLHQLRGISLFASVINRLEDIHEYQESERLAAKMAASWVVNFKTGVPEMASASSGAVDAANPPIVPMAGGGFIVSTGPGQSADFFDTKRPNVNAIPFTSAELRHAASGLRLSYSSLARDYNGTYSAQRQELVENQPGYNAMTMVVVAQFARPTYQAFATWHALTKGMPRDLDPNTVTDADYYGPPMVWIDPEKEANANLILVQARFRSDSQVIRQLGGRMADVYAQCDHAQRLRGQLGLSSTVDVPAAAVSPAKPSAPEPPANPDQQPTPANVLPFRR